MKLCDKCGACFDDDYDFCGFDGGALAPMFAGARVIGGRYLLEQRVAGGAMGVVLRATHLQVGSTVAVKLMRPQNTDTHVALARFQREAQILGQIKHPNAVLVIDFGVEQRGPDEVPYLVMEYLRGEPLSSLLEKKGALSLEELERILVPLCDAVEEAHAVGVIHRDIKPSNVVLERLRDGSEIVKVLDFGIAKFVARGRKRESADESAITNVAPSPISFAQQSSLDGDEIDELAELLADDDDADAFLDEVVSTREEVANPSSSPPPPRATVNERARGGSTPAGEGSPVRDPTTEAGFMIGTVPYMAPEQMTGERVSVRTDVHAVAVLAYQCLAGRLPYDGDDEDIIASKLSDERPTLEDVGVHVPADVDAILARAFALDPAERPSTVREISDAVKAAVLAKQVRRDEDAVTVALVQLGAITRSLSSVEAAARGWLEGATGEQHYAKARDVLLAVDAPLRRVRAALDMAEAPLTPEQKAALADAQTALSAQVAQVRRSLARIEPRADLAGAPVGGAAAEYGDYLSALWTRLDATAQEILDVLDALAGEEKGDTGPFLPVQLFAPVDAPRVATAGEIAERLLSRDPLESVDAVEDVLTNHVDVVVRAFGADADGAVATRLARGLWRHADTILLHEMSATRRTFRLLPFLAALRDDGHQGAAAAGGVSPLALAAAPFALLARVLGSARVDEDAVDLALAAMERAEDRAVLARCLLVHPSEVARRRAVAALELSDLWSVIAHPSTPIAVEGFLFDHIRERAPNEYLKIFFFCVRENLRAAATAADVGAALSLLARFFTVSCFHEDMVFEPLLDLDRTLRARGAGLTPLPGNDAAYADALAAFTARGAHESKPLEHMRDVPLPIQRKLAREGRFLSYFVCHSNDRVARETLPHLFRLEDITSYLRIPTIHRMVLTELAKRKRFFRKEPPKLALLQNPKTPAIIARMFLPLIPEEQLRVLAGNKHINPDVRRLIIALLHREKS